jgi:hypothetical protein
MLPQELEDLLHRHLFGVMTAARDNLNAAPAYDAAAASLLSHLQLGPLTVPRRFAAMRGFFVLGNSLPADHPLRPPLFDALLKTDILVLPPVAGEDWLKLSQRNNHLLLQAATLLVWPEAPDGRGHAEELAHRYLAEMTADGLFPAELCRGASCLWYSNLAVMLLTAIASISARDGCRSIVKDEHLAKAIDGFGLALSWPPEVQRLARQNLYPHPNHGLNPLTPDRGFLRDYHRSRHYLAWVPITQMLLPAQTMPVLPSPDDQFPLANDFIGGFTDRLLAMGQR